MEVGETPGASPMAMAKDKATRKRMEMTRKPNMGMAMNMPNSRKDIKVMATVICVIQAWSMGITQPQREMSAMPMMTLRK
jgi:hypothetical protein